MELFFYSCRASNLCSGCKDTYYCSRLHQKEDWSTHKLLCKDKGDQTKISSNNSNNNTNKKLSNAQIKYLFPSYIIVVENENLQSSSSNDLPLNSSTNIWEDAVTAVSYTHLTLPTIYSV